MKSQYKVNSSLGVYYLVASDSGLQGLYFKEQPGVPAAQNGSPAFAFIKLAEQQIEEYLTGERREFTIPLDIQGTAFQKKVWQQISKINYGQTISYLNIAKAIHNPQASRAVGNATGKNPLSIIIPCHRVIACNGGLAGYAGGLAHKKMLLGLEQANYLQPAKSAAALEVFQNHCHV